MSMKNLKTPAGIEPATFRFVAQHLNHCDTAVPGFRVTGVNCVFVNFEDTFRVYGDTNFHIFKSTRCHTEIWHYA